MDTVEETIHAPLTDNLEYLKAFGVTTISFSIKTGKWKATYPVPKKQRWDSGVSSCTGDTLPDLLTKLQEKLDGGKQKRVDELKKKAADALRQAKELQKRAEEAQATVKILETPWVK